ncbi:hypothetical protein BWGOE8_29960 [Bacillus mycoides]|uniref:Uncharacterized protein n=1 Tax=Bacillus mycoides TaxID=1405 RepID=A0A1E8B6F7_BACMY|nr:hypothetical protein BWGOE9_30200 [Bacillus mycoides]OFD78092.1 hypothetical protein BWGOE8_29960 [Bacillus mycoides]OFD79410.1 hypothetical protein BWGOE10_30610 [Bacillus mycoides]
MKMKIEQLILNMMVEICSSLTTIPMRMTRSDIVTSQVAERCGGELEISRTLYSVMIIQIGEMVMPDCTVFIGGGQKKEWKRCVILQGESGI